MRVPPDGGGRPERPDAQAVYAPIVPLPQQLRQLGDVGGYAPGLNPRKRFSRNHALIVRRMSAPIKTEVKLLAKPTRRANRRHRHLLFDHLVGGREQFRRHGDGFGGAVR
jgi:hypothetical protein